MCNTMHVMSFLVCSYEFGVMASFKINSNVLLQQYCQNAKMGYIRCLTAQHEHPHFYLKKKKYTSSSRQSLNKNPLLILF